MTSQDSKTKTKAIEYVTLGITLLNLLVLSVGGYFLVGRHEVRLLEANAQLKQFEIFMAQATQDLKIAKENTVLTAEALKVIASLRPNFDFGLDKEVQNKNGNLTITFNTQNQGDYRVRTFPKGLWILNKKIRDISELEEQDILVALDDIKPISDVEPNGTQSNSFDVNLSSKHPSTVFYLMVYEVKTDSVVVEIAQNYLHGVSPISVEDLATSRQIRYGQIDL